MCDLYTCTNAAQHSMTFSPTHESCIPCLLLSTLRLIDQVAKEIWVCENKVRKDTPVAAVLIGIDALCPPESLCASCDNAHCWGCGQGFFGEAVRARCPYDWVTVNAPLCLLSTLAVLAPPPSLLTAAATDCAAVDEWHP